MKQSCLLMCVLTFAAMWPASLVAQSIDFSRDVRPILSRHCFKCHGPDDKQRQVGLRLDVRDGAVSKLESGAQAIVPGNLDASELVRRISSADENEVMPPPVTKNPLTVAQQEILKKWIAAGAEYKPHWSFVAPRQALLPAVQQAAWPRTAVDRFVLARVEAVGLSPSPAADRYTLVRRVSLDLIGLPPSPDEADAFADDPSPDAFERLVDRLLASPHYGERWARRWLDLARYADTNGYEKDRQRSIWPYRDWVIRSLNADLPFDQFTIEQLAGDMLPNATLDQRVATGFHRNTMLNEEGGIDPLEFRFHAMTDRVATTGTVWLGLTIGCAQCHTHKFDPIPQRDYYQFFALLNNADEPEIDVPQPALAARRADLETKIVALDADMPNRFPPEGEWRWQAAPLVNVMSAAGATLEKLDDGSVRLSGANPPSDTYTAVIDTDLTDVAAIRMEAFTDPSLGGSGPGRTPHGNFVLSEITVTAAPRGAPDKSQPVKLARATADAAQDGFPPAHAIDGDAKTGWAIHVAGANWNVNRTATFTFEKPVGHPGGTRWTIKLDQQHGSQHTLGRFRLSLGEHIAKDDSRPMAERRREHLDRRFSEWQQQEAARAVRWSVLRPVAATSTLPLLTILDDGSVLASGDQSKSDTYDVTFRGNFRGVTAVRLETIPDDRLPKRGPGRVYYEGPPGEFFLSDISLLVGPASRLPGSGTKEEASRTSALRFARASHSFANGGNGAAAALDDNKQTGWSINGGQGKPHVAVFNLAEPLAEVDAITLRMLFERYYAAGLGRFRISVTTDPQAQARGLPAEVDDLLSIPAAQRTSDHRQRLLQLYLSVAPELAAERQEVQRLRDQIPAYPTSLVMTERPADNPRTTHRHHRGEFLQPKESVEPDVLSFLPKLPTDAARNRLSFARWLVDPANPLTGRVTVNRHWSSLFGRGLVRTTEDFGYQGELPTHPELLDWLASEFVDLGFGDLVSGRPEIPKSPNLQVSKSNAWSVKRLHRLLVTSATYQQSSRVTPERLARDANNELLARGPRFRLEAELLRDAALKISGLLSMQFGGPSVFPPQPANVSTEGAYGQLLWKVSEGGDRYRRGLYTFSKRTAPYAMFTTFDAPSGEACVARRELSNTPLQALTLLNDAVFMEAAQVLGGETAALPSLAAEARVEFLFRRVLIRPPMPEERVRLVDFFQQQKQRFAAELDAAKVTGYNGEAPADRAAWTVTARVLLNLDEAITKN